LSEQRRYRSWTAQQKIEIVLAGLRGDRSVKGVCRGKEERTGARELRRKIRALERALGRTA
jgi:transposase-like protein